MAEQFIKSPASLISASSRLGLDGNVQIESPLVNMDEFLVVLPGDYVETELPKGCQSITDIDQLSTFRATTVREGMMMTPGGFPE